MRIRCFIHALIEQNFPEPVCSDVFGFLVRYLTFPSGYCHFPFFILAMHSLIVSIDLSASYWTFNHFLERDISKLSPAAFHQKIFMLQSCDWTACNTLRELLWIRSLSVVAGLLVPTDEARSTLSTTEHGIHTCLLVSSFTLRICPFALHNV